MSPGSSPLSCFLWALVLFQWWRYISAPSALTVWGIGAPELTGKTAAWALSALLRCRGRSCLGDKRQQLHLCIPQLHALLLLNLPKGLPVPLLPARLWSAVPKRWEAADSLVTFLHQLLGEKRSTYRFVKPLGPGALHASISCQFFFHFCPWQLQNKAWEHEVGAPWSPETRNRLRPGIFLYHYFQAYFITYGKLTCGINNCAYSKYSWHPCGNWIVREPSEHATALWTWIPPYLLLGIYLPGWFLLGDCSIWKKESSSTSICKIISFINQAF